MNDARQLIRDDFGSFVRKSYAFFHNGESLGDQPYINYMIDELSQVTPLSATRTIINLPPGHLKTFLASVCLPAWLLAHYPSKKILLVTCSERLVSSIARKIKQILQSAWFKDIFQTRIAPGHATLEDFGTTKGGGLFATSTGGSLTGHRGEVVIFDDPLEIRDANNPEKLASVNELFSSSILTRLNNPGVNSALIVAHRIHENDLGGFLAGKPGWRQVVLPFRATEDQTYQTTHGVWRRFKGDLLRPNAYPASQVAEIEMTPTYDLLYQQGVEINERRIEAEHFPRFNIRDLPRDLPIVLSVDTNMRPGMRNSFAVIQVWWRDGAEYYLIDQFREQCDFSKLLDTYKRLCRQYNPCVSIIESTASGAELIRTSKIFWKNMRVIPIIPDRRSKLERLAQHIPTIRAGQVRLPFDAAFAEGYIEELTSIEPKFYDQIDATVQFLNWVPERPLAPPPRPVVGMGVCYSSGRYLMPSPPRRPIRFPAKGNTAVRIETRVIGKKPTK
jgi:phage terminase large subunit-like protein